MATKTCACGCGETVPGGQGRKYATPACRERAKRRREGIGPRKRIDRKDGLGKVCLSCDKPITGRGKYCKAVKCLKAKIKREKEMKVAANKRSRDREKRLRLESKPRYCKHCGNQLTVEDSLRYSVCHRDECKLWWETEGQDRINKRNADVRKKRRKEQRKKRRKEQWEKRKKQEAMERPMENRGKAGEKLAGKAGERSMEGREKAGAWCHEDYVAEQAALKKLNGKKCRDCGKPLRGDSYYRCPGCLAKISAKGDRIDGDFVFNL